MNNVRRITWIAYLMYFFVGTTVILPGILMGAVASALGIDTADVGSAYSAAGFGMLLSIIVSGFLVERLSVRIVLQVCVGALIGAVGLMPWVNSVAFFSTCVFVVGLCAGMLIALANILLVHCYAPGERSSKLIFLDFLFSFGALVCPIIASRLLALNVEWYYIYFCVSLAAGFVALISLRTSFPHFEATEEQVSVRALLFSGSKVSGLNILIVALACFCYTTSEVSFSFWIVEHTQNKFNLDIEAAGVTLSVFWFSIAIGRFLSSYLIKLVPFGRFILSAIVLAMVSYFFMLQATTIREVYILIGVMGLGYSSLYPSLISYGTLIVKKAPPKLVSLYLTGGTLGFMMGASLLTSHIKRLYGSYSSLMASLGFLVMVLILMAISFCLKKRS